MADETTGPVPLGADVTPECGRVWGYHREHYCVEPETHNDELTVVHYCDCDDEAFERSLVEMEAEQ